MISRYHLVPVINQKIQNFVDNAHVRLKRSTPNLGDWLTYLTVAPHARWDDVAATFLQETFMRNVMWYSKEQPGLADINDATANRTRVEDTFRLTKVSRDLIAFQVLFLEVARPKNLTLEQVVSPSPSPSPSPSSDTPSTSSFLSPLPLSPSPLPPSSPPPPFLTSED